MNVTELIQRVRDLVDERATVLNESKEWEDDELLRNLNQASDQLWKNARLLDNDWGVDILSLDTFSVTQTTIDDKWVRLTAAHEFPTIKAVFERISDGGGSWREILPTTFRGAAQDHSWPYHSTFAHKSWQSGANSRELFITNTAQAIDTTRIYVVFTRRPPEMVRFTNPATPSTTTLEVDITTSPSLGKFFAKENHYYGTYVECIDGNNADPEGRKIAISGWTANTHPTWTMTLAQAHGLGASPGYDHTWEVVPIWPEEHHELIALLAAKRALVSSSAPEERVAVAQEVAIEMNMFVQNIQSRQFQMPRHVFWEEFSNPL